MAEAALVAKLPALAELEVESVAGSVEPSADLSAMAAPVEVLQFVG